MGTVRDWLSTVVHREKPDSEAVGESARQVPNPDREPSLSDQQRAAVYRGAETLRRFGGVLLADAVGLGKTRVAVALARRVASDARRRSGDLDPVLFAVPARLRPDWRRAIEAVGWQCGRDARLISHHRLSRTPCEDRPPVVVVDEAHRFRNPSARRSRHLAMLTARSPPILVTATPVCTRRHDLRQLLSYFLTDPVVASMVGMGLEEAFEADEAGEFDVVEILEEVVIRRRRPDFGTSGRPDVDFQLLQYDASDDEAWLWNHLERRLRDLNFEATGEHWPRGLLINNLLRMWESGAAALHRSLRQLMHFHERWLAAARAGCRIERPDFRAIFGGVDRRQQAFPFLYDQASRGRPDAERRRDVEADYRALEELTGRVETVRRQKEGITDAVARSVADRDGRRFLVFAAWRASAVSIFEALADRGIRAGLVTGDEARATGLGRVSDRDILDRFRRDGPRHRTLRVLVATDCLAEGVNLQGCRNVILADLPYSPVRLEQRIGRIARPGADVESVTVHLPRPDSWTDTLGMRDAITERLRMADGLGVGQQLLTDTEIDDDPAHDHANAGPDGGPLAAMTLERRLYNGLAAGDKADPPLFGRIDGTVSKHEGELWIRVSIEAAAIHRIWVRFPAGDAEPVVRLSEQLPGLTRLADDRRPVVSWEPEGRQWNRARHWLRRRRSLLEAARLAPPLLGDDAAPTRAWQRIRRAVDEGRLETDDAQFTSWRRRLLQAHPPGVEFELEEFLETRPDLDELIEFVEQLPEARRPGPVEVDIEAALLWSTDASEP